MGARRTERTCVTCGKRFVGRDPARFCQKKCMRSRGTLDQRFWRKVDRRGPDECWPWLAGKFKTGYGGIRIGDRSVKAHRVALELTLGEPLPALEVCHRCDNKVCCNPGHLFLGTHRDNMEDLARKLLHPNRKLTPDQVRSIRERRAGGATASAVAREFGVSKGCVDGIVKGRSWRHVA
jgi:hypothetical protein